MMKIVKRENFRVIIKPAIYYSRENDEEYLERTCSDIKEQVKRHIDNVRNVYVERDTNITCSFCGYRWEVDEKTGEPVCCTEAIDEFNLTNPLKH